MPLTAVHNGKPVVSIFMTDDDWAQLRIKASMGELNMSCGTPAITRVSSPGLRHFAHKRAVECGHPGCSETPQHQAAKAAVARAAVAAGWNVTIEHRAPDGEWVADVLAEKDGRRVALEIQWSRQSAEDFSWRQERYRRAGVECFWFIHRRNRSTALEAKVPFAVLTGDSAPFGIEATGDIFTDEGPALEAAVAEALDGTDVDEALIRIAEVEFNLDPMDCTLCGQASTTWRISSLRGDTLCGKTIQIPGEYKMWSTEKHEALFVPEAAAALAAAPEEEGPWPPLTRLRMFHSRTAGTTYLAQGCAHCARGVYGDFFVSQSFGTLVAVKVQAPVDFKYLASHRCLDRGHSLCPASTAPHYGHGYSEFAGTVPAQDQPDTTVTVKALDSSSDVREAIGRLTGSMPVTTVTPKTKSSNPEAPAQISAASTLSSVKRTKSGESAPLSCDHCTPDNPCAVVHECLCRRLEAVSLSDDGYWHHVCESISRGDRGENGLELMRRLLQRAVDSRVLHGPGGAYAGRTTPHLHYQEQAA